MKPNPQLFIIPNGEDFIFFLPLEKFSMTVNKDARDLIKNISSMEITEDLQEFIDKMIRYKVLVDDDFQTRKFREIEDYRPTGILILPTYNCNLRCSYCYASSDCDNKLLDINIAKKAIDFIVNNAVIKNVKSINIGFHGGGEPLLIENIPFINDCVSYSREICYKDNIKPNFNVVTNGTTLHKLDLDWLKNTFNNINISLDGPEDIQNSQRPKDDGSPSHAEVLLGVKLLEDNKIHYGIRATITKESVHRMVEIYKHFSEISTNNSFHLEPLFECGRCETTKMESPDRRVFADNLLKTIQYAESIGKRVRYSGGDIKKINNTFCGGAGRNFFLTPDGYVTTCLEECRPISPEDNPFIIGKYTDGEFNFNYDKINFLKLRTIENIEDCKDCYSKYSCSGDCLSKVLKQTGDMFKTRGNERCYTNRKVIRHQIEKLFQE